jgi:hypothetical protein
MRIVLASCVARMSKAKFGAGVWLIAGCRFAHPGYELAAKLRSFMVNDA